MSEIRTDTINNASGDNDSGIDLSTNDQIILKTANTTAVTVDASQNVGIGTSTIQSFAKLEIGGSAGAQTGANQALYVKAPSTTAGEGVGIRLSAASGSNEAVGIIGVVNNASGTSGSMTFHTYNGGADIPERMRIDNSGYSLFGTTALPSSSVVGFSISPSIVSTNPHFSSCGSATGSVTHFNFINGNGTVGNITTNAGATAFNTSSDHRLKENVTVDWDATTRLKQLNPVRFNFIADADTTVDGFLAHEVQSVVPEAITGTHNEVDDDGNPVYQSIDQSKLVPLLVKTIQELEARIEALENA